MPNHWLPAAIWLPQHLSPQLANCNIKVHWYQYLSKQVLNMLSKYRSINSFTASLTFCLIIKDFYRKDMRKNLSADGCFQALRISPTWILSKLTLTSLSFSATSLSEDFALGLLGCFSAPSLSADFALGLLGCLSPVDFSLIFQNKWN